LLCNNVNYTGASCKNAETILVAVVFRLQQGKLLLPQYFDSILEDVRDSVLFCSVCFFFFFDLDRPILQLNVKHYMNV